MGLEKLKEIMQDDNKHNCCYCGVYLASKKERTIEHLLPISRGGNNHIYNRKTCCKSCNYARGNRDYFDWLDVLQRKLEKAKKKINTSSETQKISKMIENVIFWNDYCKQWDHLINRKYIMPIHKEKYKL